MPSNIDLNVDVDVDVNVSGPLQQVTSRHVKRAFCQVTTKNAQLAGHDAAFIGKEPIYLGT